MECVFCRIIEGGAPGEVVAADDHTVAFLDINPVVDGHTLVVPRRHVRDLFELDDEEAGPLLRAARVVAERLSAALNADGVNLYQANGAAAAQSVFHLHLHVLPRHHGDGLAVPIGRTGRGRSSLRRVASLVRAVE